MNQEKPADDQVLFGEKLLDMQSFSAARAKRYREELEKLLVHRITTVERWILGIFAVYLATAFIVGGIVIAYTKKTFLYPGMDQSRLILAATIAISGLALGGWLLWVAVQGGYGRGRGDFMGVFIALLFCGGLGFTFINMAWDVTEAMLRVKLALGGGTFVVVGATCMILAHFQHLHRQIQEKLLRIEYHLAELMELNTKS